MQQKWFILLSVATGTFMATLDASIVNVALPSITSSLHTTLSHSRWVVIAYLFSITGLLLFFGKLADVISRKMVFQLGFFIFSLGSFLCGLGTSIQDLIIARTIQGCGAAMLMSNGPAIITAAFPSNERGKALGILSMAVSVGLAMGPSAGGFLVRLFGWPSIFFVNCPFGLMGMYFVYRFMHPTLGMALNGQKEIDAFLRESKQPIFKRLRIYYEKISTFDWVGIILWISLQFSFVLAIDRENLLGFIGPAQRIISFASIGLLLLFIIWEWSVKEPVLDLTLFRSRLFFLSNLSGLFNFIAVSSISLLMPFYLQNVRALSPDRVGLIMTAIPITTLCVAPLAGRWSDIYGSRLLSSIGMFILCTAMGLLSLPLYGFYSASVSAVMIYMVFMGIGTGLFQSPNSNAIMGDVPPQHLGVASALLATIRNFGLVIGTASSSALLMYFLGNQNMSYLDPSSGFAGKALAATSQSNGFINALRFTFLCLSVVCSLGIVSCLMSRRKKW